MRFSFPDHHRPRPTVRLYFMPVLMVMVGLILMMNSAMARASDYDGYRSAQFGMDEAAVIKAIEDDFAITEDAVVREQNAVQKTTSLTINVDGIVEFTGRTEITYIFGYRSATLIQVNLMWRVRSNFLNAKPRLRWVARVMANRSALLGVKRDETNGYNKTLDGATLLFRGQSRNGMVSLISLKVPSEDKASLSASLTSDEAYWLRVAFISNVSDPDIFKIDPGQF